jgi:hypothetical protein
MEPVPDLDGPGSPTLVLIEPYKFSDCVKLLNEEHWVTAGEDGHLAVWGAMKKKPLVIVSFIHLLEPILRIRIRRVHFDVGPDPVPAAHQSGINLRKLVYRPFTAPF